MPSDPNTDSPIIQIFKMRLNLKYPNSIQEGGWKFKQGATSALAVGSGSRWKSNCFDAHLIIHNILWLHLRLLTTQHGSHTFHTYGLQILMNFFFT